MNKLPPQFYRRDVLTVAKELLGKIFVKESASGKLSGRIVEVEAYDGATDRAAHSYNGKTKRNEIMFEYGGLLYVYFTYGMHNCSNIVAGKKNEGQAILLRGIEPLYGIEIMSLNRYGRKSISKREKIILTNGPAKICEAFNITNKHNGTDLQKDKIYLLNAPQNKEIDICTSTRIGIKKSAELPWRFYLKDNPFVSKR